MNEVFIISDYESGSILSIYLTDNSSGCYDVLQDLDSEDDKPVDWELEFLNRCKKLGIKIELTHNVEIYNY